MVDALREVWRVLTERGTLLDLRPRPEGYGLDLVAFDAAVAIGRMDTTGRTQDDAAAEAAVARAVEQGLFAERSRVELDVEIFWDTVDDLERFVAMREWTRVFPSYEELEKAYRSMAAGLRTAPRLRSTRRLVLTAFERGPALTGEMPPRRPSSAPPVPP